MVILLLFLLRFGVRLSGLRLRVLTCLSVSRSMDTRIWFGMHACCVDDCDFELVLTYMGFKDRCGSHLMVALLNHELGLLRRGLGLLDLLPRSKSVRSRAMYGYRNLFTDTIADTQSLMLRI